MTDNVDTDGLRFSATEIVELRQYTLHPGTRDTLVRVFEDYFIEGQEEAGIRIGGIYLDESDPDRFVWFRGFTNLDQRMQALESFYFGPVWELHRDVANGTMIDSNDVLLLQPTDPPHRPQESATWTTWPRQDRVQVSVYVYEADLECEDWLSTVLHRRLEEKLGTSVATWRSHPGPNAFTKLPVRTDNVFVWAATFSDEDARRNALARLHSSPEWTTELAPVIDSRCTVQALDLRPTRRSRHPRPGVVGTESLPGPIVRSSGRP